MANRWPLAAAVWVVGALGAGCSAGGEASLPACDVLRSSVPSVEAPDAEGGAPGGGGTGTTTVELALARGLSSLDPSGLTVYLVPGRADELEAVEADIAEQAEVIATRTVDEAATLRLFRQLFAGEDQILRNVEAEDLPTSVEVATSSPDAASRVARWAERDSRVYEVSSFGTGTFSETMVAERDRARWRAVADRLDRVEDRPSWATDSAAVVRAVLDDGEVADDELAGRLSKVRGDLLQAGSRCGAPAAD